MSKHFDGHELPIYEMYKAIDWDANTYEDERNGKTITILDNNFGNCRPFIDEFLRKALAANNLGCKGKVQETVMSDQLLLSRYFKLLNVFIAEYSTDIEFSANETLFFKGIEALDLFLKVFNEPDDVHYPGVTGRDLFNNLLVWIRNESKTPRFRKMSYARHYNARRNFVSARDYEQALFNLYPHLLVLRFDVGWRSEYSQDITIDEALETMARFLNNRRCNKLFFAMVGYICKLEWGPRKGVHFHMMFIFDGNRVQGEWLTQLIGEYWRDCITEGRGTFHNCNRSENKYKRCGNGMISKWETEKRDELVNVAIRYITMKEKFFKYKFGVKVHVFTRGVAPCVRIKKVGRSEKKRV